MENEEKKILRLASFVIPHAVVLWFCLVMILSGAATLSLDYGFGVDSAGRIYVGENQKIGVYENGHRVSTIPTQFDSHCVTVDAEDHIRVITPDRIYVMDLSGTEIEREELNSNDYYALTKDWKKVVTPAGDRYKCITGFGWPRIVKNNSETVYKLDGLSVAVSFICGIAVISMFGNGIWLIYSWNKKST